MCYVTSGQHIKKYQFETNHSIFPVIANIEDIAATISRAVGPSGPNIDYLFNLADAIRGMGQDDSHVFQLEKEVKKLREESESKKSTII